MSDGLITAVKFHNAVHFLLQSATTFSYNLNAHLGMKPVESHDRSKEEEGEVEVVFQQVGECEVAVFLFTVLQSKAHTAHDAKTAASIEQDVLQVKRAGHQGLLQKEYHEPHASSSHMWIEIKYVYIHNMNICICSYQNIL